MYGVTETYRKRPTSTEIYSRHAGSIWKKIVFLFTMIYRIAVETFTTKNVKKTSTSGEWQMGETTKGRNRERKKERKKEIKKKKRK